MPMQSRMQASFGLHAAKCVLHSELLARACETSRIELPSTALAQL